MKKFQKKGIILVGCPGSGKTTLAKIIAKEYGLQHVPLDPIIAGARAISKEFFENTKKVTNLLEWKISCKSTAPLIQGLLGTYASRDSIGECVVEGFRIHPEMLISQFSDNFTFVALGYAENSPIQKLQSFREFDIKNWTNKEADEALLLDISFFIDLSIYLREISEKLGILYIDTSYDFEKTISIAAKEIMKNY